MQYAVTIIGRTTDPSQHQRAENMIHLWLRGADVDEQDTPDGPTWRHYWQGVRNAPVDPDRQRALDLAMERFDWTASQSPVMDTLRAAERYQAAGR